MKRMTTRMILSPVTSNFEQGCWTRHGNHHRRHFNTKVRSDNTNLEYVIEKHDWGSKNEPTDILSDALLIFPHKNIIEFTWKAPDGSSVNQIDHLIIILKWRSLLDVKAFRGADVKSDHYLVRAIIQLKLRKAPHSVRGKLYTSTEHSTCEKSIWFETVLFVIWKRPVYRTRMR
jgi:hypothetical protein